MPVRFAYRGVKRNAKHRVPAMNAQAKVAADPQTIASAEARVDAYDWSGLAGERLGVGYRP